MPDLLVKLYDLPDIVPHIQKLQEEGVHVRTSMAYEKHQVVQWVLANFGQGWASECDVSFSNSPITCFIATENARIVGFACYDSTAKNFFGPIGVAENCRNRNIGETLLLSCLKASASAGYRYSIIGGVESVEFYKKTAGAIEIPGSSPGIYGERLE